MERIIGGSQKVSLFATMRKKASRREAMFSVILNKVKFDVFQSELIT
jgi:hypothetical protein